MILGTLREIGLYLDTAISRAVLAYVEDSKIGQKTAGVWEELGPDLKAIFLTQSGYTEGLFETHEIWRDIHIVLKGTDEIFLASRADATVHQPYRAEEDYALYKGTFHTRTILREGSMAVLAPGELHTNLITGTETLKLVIKHRLN